MGFDPAPLAVRAEQLRRLHDRFLVLPNAWDAGSARTLVALGFPAIATTSSGVSDSLGFADRQLTPPDVMFAAVASIAASIDAPTTADLEAGYALPPEELVGRLLEAGAVGLNLEDSDHSGGSTKLLEANAHADFLRAVKETARARGVDVFLNARIDVHLRKVGDPSERLDEAIRRARLYLDAGADCIYPIFVNDDVTLAPLIALGAPVNVLYMPDGPSFGHLAATGVRRVTFGGHLQEAAMAAVATYLRQVDAI